MTAGKDNKRLKTKILVICLPNIHLDRNYVLNWLQDPILVLQQKYGNHHNSRFYTRLYMSINSKGHRLKPRLWPVILIKKISPPLLHVKLSVNP